MLTKECQNKVNDAMSTQQHLSITISIQLKPFPPGPSDNSICQYFLNQFFFNFSYIFSTKSGGMFLG